MSGEKTVSLKVAPGREAKSEHSGKSDKKRIMYIRHRVTCTLKRSDTKNSVATVIRAGTAGANETSGTPS